MSTTWKMDEAKATVDRINTPRMDVIRAQAGKNGESGNDCQWLQCAVQVLVNNCAHPIVFAEALRDLMINSRGKNQNIFITGRANCGNTFLISPRQNRFKTFSNPSNDTYGWVLKRLN